MLFLLIAALAVFAALLLAILIWRARKPMKLPPLKAVSREQGEKKRAVWVSWVEAIDYLRTRREPRYRTQWTLMMGPQGGGKSSLLASLNPSLVQTPTLIEQCLVQNGSDWCFLSDGVLIDPNGELPAAEPGSKAAQAWLRLLKAIDGLRPERALDAVVLVIPARALQNENAQQRLVMAETLRNQLGVLERQYEFSLPVYVVVSASDTVVGFNAFWQAQPPELRSEIFGWSMPSQVPDNPGGWVDLAFDSIGERLKLLQVRTAAENKDMDAEMADQFFLFPRHFQQLRAPLQQCLSVIFQSSSWKTGFFCRGLYFTGRIAFDVADSMHASEIIPDGLPVKDVCFVDDLVTRKILAEPYLGRPTRSGTWSRNALIRRWQIAGVTGFAILLLALCVAGINLQRQTANLQASLQVLQKIEQQTYAKQQAPGTCQARETVFLAIEQIARIQSATVYWPIPASWLDRRISHDSARFIADGVVQKTILAGIACRLEQQAQELSNAPQLNSNDVAGSNDKGTSLPYAKSDRSMLEQIQKIEDLEKNLTRFQKIAAPASLKNGAMLDSFIALTDYAYQAELPKAAAQDKGLLEAALASTQYPTPLALPANMKEHQADQIDKAAQQVREQLDAEVQTGNTLLAQLNQDGANNLQDTRHFNAWLQWVSSEWSPSTVNANPCTTMEKNLQIHTTVLRGYGYPSDTLEKATSRFDTANCYQKNMRVLSSTQMAPYGSLFVRSGKELTLNPLLLGELTGLNALSQLSFMQVQNTRAFICQTKASGWRASQIGLGNNYVAEYDNFITGLAPAANTTSQRPLYQRLALRQLEQVLDSTLSDAQIPATPVVNPTGVSSDQEMAQESGAFAALLDPLLTLQHSYSVKGFAGSLTQLSQCVGNYSSVSLGRIQNLVDISLLYEVPSRSGNGALFDLGTTPVISDYLSRQLARVQILSGYATPYLSYLNSSGAPDTARDDNTESAAYWSNTESELSDYVKSKDPTGQVALLDNLFIQRMPGLNASNCNQFMTSYKPAEHGNDLFSLRRLKLEAQIQAACSGERDSQALSTYNELSARFNRDLAGRYPFGPLGGADANLYTARIFFADYAGQSTTLRQSLQGLKGPYWDSARQFLSQLDAAAAFFHGSLTLYPTPPTSSAPSTTDGEGVDASLPTQPINLNIQFHAQAANSPGANQLVEWRLSSASKSAVYPNRGNTLDWNFGQPLVLDLQWASGSAWQPAADLQQPDLQIEGGTASFAATGDWALLRLIERHRSGGGTSGATPNRVLLEFQVPVVGNSGAAGKITSDTAKMYVGLNLSSKDPKTNTLTSLKPPTGFPHAAP